MRRFGRLGVLMWILAPLAAGAQDVAPGADHAAGAEICFVPFSHLDFYWGAPVRSVSRGCRIIAKAIQPANRSPAFRFLLEDEVFVAGYLDAHAGTPETRDLKRLVKVGRIEIAPKRAAIFQELPDGEVHARNMALGKR